MRLPIKQLAQTVLEMLVVRKNKKIKAKALFHIKGHKTHMAANCDVQPTAFFC